MTAMVAPRQDLITARRRLQAALAALEADRPTPAMLRKAHAKTTGASEAIDGYLEGVMAMESARNKALARQLAVGRKDARGRKRTPQTMPGYNKGRPNPAKGRRYKATPPSVNEILRMLALAPALRKSFDEECILASVKAQGQGARKTGQLFVGGLS